MTVGVTAGSVPEVVPTQCLPHSFATKLLVVGAPLQGYRCCGVARTEIFSLSSSENSVRLTFALDKYSI